MAAVWHARRLIGKRGLCFAILAVLTPALIAFVGLCIDIGVLALANAHLKTVADAAALAGAKQLNDPARLASNFNITGDLSRARNRAIAIGGANKVLSDAAVLLDNPDNSSGGDILIGYKNMAASGSALDTTPASKSLYNTVQVTARRDSDHGGMVPAFFSRALGFSGTSVSVTSMATVQNYAIQGFKCTPPETHTHLIPIALSLTTYNAMLAGLTTDNYTWKNGTVHPGGDGIYESSLYPVSSGPGNWGTLLIGVSSNGTSTLAPQIQYGVTTDQIATASPTGCSLQLGSGTSVLQLTGNPGVSLGLKPALTSMIGQVVVVPVYDPAQSGGSGSNFVYGIVKFAAVAVLDTDFNGSDSEVYVQPALVTDSTAILGSPQPSWASGGIVRLRLTQ
jgi:hypothetical protein